MMPSILNGKIFSACSVFQQERAFVNDTLGLPRTRWRFLGRIWLSSRPGEFWGCQHFQARLQFAEEMTMEDGQTCYRHQLPEPLRVVFSTGENFRISEPSRCRARDLTHSRTFKLKVHESFEACHYGNPVNSRQQAELICGWTKQLPSQNQRVSNWEFSKQPTIP